MLMGKVRIKQTKDGSWVADAVVVTKMGHQRIRATTNKKEFSEEGNRRVYRQLVLDLFTERDKAQNGANEPAGGK